MHASLHWIRHLLIALTAAGLAAQKTPEEALNALVDGNRRFAADRSVPQPVGEGVRRTLARGQSPFAVVICCSDSRVPPEHIFNCGLGELFVIRIAGNTCDRETIASIEYAVEHLNTPLCVVLGHENCGAISATIGQVQSLERNQADPAPSRAIQQLIEQIEPAVRKARKRDLGGKDLHDACEEENAHLTLHECLRRSPLLRRYVQVGRLQMVAGRYHLGTGEVEWLPNRPLPPEPRYDVDVSLQTASTTVPPHVALRMLQAGHRRFLGDSMPAGELTAQRREELTHGQQPLAIVLTCADSRVAPEHVFDAGLGELCVIRVAGNVVNDDILASIEHAATHTGASLLIVMGHTECGTITAAANFTEDQQLSPNMRALFGLLEPSVQRVRDQATSPQDLVELAVKANVLRTAVEVQSRSRILRSLEQKGRFAVLPTIYDIASGDLIWLKSVAQEETAAPMPAPMGETMPAPGHETQEPSSTNGHDDHEQPDLAAAVHGVGSRGGHTHDDNGAHGTDFDWASTPTETMTAHDQDHDHASHDAETEGHAGQAHDHDSTTGHGHDVRPHGHGHGSYSTNPWLQPIPLIGIAGVLSLLLAAAVALFKK